MVLMESSLMSSEIRITGEVGTSIQYFFKFTTQICLKLIKNFSLKYKTIKIKLIIYKSQKQKDSLYPIMSFISKIKSFFKGSEPSQHPLYVKKQKVDISNQQKVIKNDKFSKNQSEAQSYGQLRFYEDSDLDQECDQNDGISKSTRDIVQNTKIHPFNGIGFIKCTYVDPETQIQYHQRGTGFIIGDNIIMTALHVLFFEVIKIEKHCQITNKKIQVKKYPNQFAHKVQFYNQQMLRQSQDNKKGIKGTMGIRAIKFYYNNLFFNQSHPNFKSYDFAVIKLEKNRYINKKHILNMNFNFNLSQNIATGSKIMVCGYSGDSDVQKLLSKQFFQQKLLNTNQMQERDDQFFYYRFTVKGGNSGGPILLKNQSSRYQVIGVHKGIANGRGRCNTIKVINNLNKGFSRFFSNFSLPLQFIQIQFSWKTIKILIHTDDEQQNQENSRIYFQKAYNNKQNQKKTLDYYLESLKISQKVFGSESIQVAKILNNMASVCTSLHNFRQQDDFREFSEAFKWYERSLEIFRKKLGHQSIQVASTLNNVACFHYCNKGYKQALKIYQMSLQIICKKLGAKSIKIAQTLFNIGLIYFYNINILQNCDLKQYEHFLEIRRKMARPDLLKISDKFFNIENMHELVQFVVYDRKIKSQKYFFQNVIYGEDSLLKSRSDLINYLKKYVMTQKLNAGYANAASTVIHLTICKIKGRQGGYPDLRDIRDQIIQQYGCNGVYLQIFLKQVCPRYRLRVREVNFQGAKLSISMRKPVIASFFLKESQWWAFSNFFRLNKKGVLTSYDLNKFVQGSNFRSDGRLDGRHTVVFVDYCKDYLMFMNSWGAEWGDQGFFKVANIDVLTPKFFEIYCDSSDLTERQHKLYNNCLQQELFKRTIKVQFSQLSS